MSILVFGDSNTHGTVALTSLDTRERHPPGARWPDVMAARLGRTVIAEGQPGRTTVHDDPMEGPHKNGLTVLPSLLESHRPLDLVVVMLGTNDCKARFGLRGWDVAAGAARLARAAMASDAGPDGAAPDLLLIAPVPVEEAGVLAEMFQGAGPRSRAVAPALREQAERLGAGFLDAGRFVSVDPVDGVHLSAEAHATLGHAVAEAVERRSS